MSFLLFLIQSFILSQPVPAGTLTAIVTSSGISTTLPAYDFPEGPLISLIQDLVKLAGSDSSTKTVLDKYNLVLKDTTGIQTYPPPPPPPTTGAISVVPATVSGHVVNLTFSFPIPSGTSAQSVNMVINSTLTGVAGCYFIYTPGNNVINLLKDDGTTLQPLTPGSSATVGNSQCSIVGNQVIAGSASTAVTVTLQALTFTSAFVGSKTVWATWYSGGGQQGTWQSIGTVTVQ